LLTQCQNGTTKPTNTIKKTPVALKEITPTYVISGTVTYATYYCPDGANYNGSLPGGIREKFKPLQKLELFIYTLDSSNERKAFIDSIKTTALGEFQSELPAGHYGVFLREQFASTEEVLKRYPRKKMFQVDKSCFKKWHKTPQINFSVTTHPISMLKIALIFNENTDIACPCIKHLCINP